MTPDEIKAERDELKRACEDIARTVSGQRLYHYLLRELMDTQPVGATDEMLQTHNGRRIFARELVGLFQATLPAPAQTEAAAPRAPTAHAFNLRRPRGAARRRIPDTAGLGQ